MSVLTKIQRSFGAGLKAMNIADGPGWRTLGGQSFGKLLPGTRFDYAREAGDLQDNAVLRMGLKFIEDANGEARPVVRRPGADGKLQILPTHPLIDLLQRPNKFYSWSTLQAGINISLKLDGNAYILKLYSEAGKLSGLFYLPHFLVDIIAGGEGNWIERYEYRFKGRVTKIPVENMLHLKDGVDYNNVRKGLSRTGAALREVCTVNERATFEATLLRNGGVPTVIINQKEGKTFDAGQAKAMKKKWSEFQGDDRFQAMFSTMAIDVHEVAFSPNEMALDKLATIPIAVLCGTLNLDPMVLGLPSTNKTYSNYEEANRAAWEQCVIPGHRLVDEQITLALMDEVLFSRPGDVLGRDYSEVRALQEDANELHARARDDYQKGILKRKDARRLIGEEVDEVADDVYFTDLNAAPAGQGDNNAGGNDAAQMKAIRRFLGAKWRRNIPRAIELDD